jgi:hypothetical protein
MEQKFKLEFPLDLEIKYEDPEELLELASKEEFVTFMFGERDSGNQASYS